MADLHVHGYTIKKTRSKLWGVCYKIVCPDGSNEVWGGNKRDLIYHYEAIDAYWYVIRLVQDILLNKLDAIKF